MHADYLPYPSHDAQRPERLLGFLGSFWAFIYSGREAVRELLAARGALAEQTYQNLLESWQSISRLTVPPTHRERWFPLVIKKSAALDGRIRFGDDVTFNGTPRRLFGLPVTAEPRTWEAPPGFLTAAAASDGIREPSRIWTKGVDYAIEPPSDVGPARITFRTNPFRLDSFARADLPDGDQELTVWLHQAEFDTGNLVRHWGYVLDIQSSPPTEAARDTFNAVYDALTGGSVLQQVQRSLIALTGVPLVESDGEVVERIDEFNDLLWIVTDRQAYPFRTEAELLVGVKDELAAGQALTDALVVAEANNGQPPAGWNALALGEALLTLPVAGELTFVDQEMPWEGEDFEGRLRLSCALEGHPLDIEAFWDEVHARGVAAGQTLANLLDRRPADARVTAVEMASIPESVNPLEFLVSNLLRFHTFFASIKAACLRTRGAPGLLRGDFLRKFVPPESMLLLKVELPPMQATATIRDGEITNGPAAEPHEEALTSGTHRVTARPVSTTCQ